MKVNTIINSDCLEGLKQLPDASVDCCVTSPPYYGLRDYGHDGQIGMEETPEAFVQRLVDVFTEVKRVLKPEGTLWINIGDSYAASSKNGTSESVNRSSTLQGGKRTQANASLVKIKIKDLIGVPWMLAFALRSSGWYLRQDIIWHKPNPMPESVTDRCTKSHEYIFLFSKSSKYFYDYEAIKVEINESQLKRIKREKDKYGIRELKHSATSAGVYRKSDLSQINKNYAARNTDGSNKRSVWTVATKPFIEAHFATFPEDLIVDCIKAGCPINGTVLDPFMGAGTTALVARKLNRNYIGFELNPDYIKIAEKRLYNELGMFQ